MDFKGPEYDKDITIKGNRIGHASIDLNPDDGKLVSKVTASKSLLDGLASADVSVSLNFSVVGLLAYGASKSKKPWVQNIANKVIKWVSKTEESAFAPTVDVAGTPGMPQDAQAQGDVAVAQNPTTDSSQG